MLDTDHIAISTFSDGSRSASRKTAAMNLHADFYLNLLLLLDPQIDGDDFWIEMPNIYLAYHRLLNEEVGSIFHPGMIEAKIRGVMGGYADRYLGKLLQKHLETPQDVEQVELAIQMLEADEVEYHVRVEALKQLLEEARKH